ncbi:MAG: caspase family protein [Phormidesmis sp. CAN_BIN44]|nr:caspase family protein [Phormidesmis sp. CAN_BIN44]
MKFAFLIGVSNYDSLDSLPACEKDVLIMESLLQATNSYEQVKVVKEDTNSDAIKSEFRKFAKELIEKSVEEVFIYFSGHGFQKDGEMFLCCSDYSSQRPGSTSISNSEIDEIIRSIAPELTVKIIDACQSGYQYIKDINFSTQDLSKKSIDKFIFMASSQQQENSLANQNTSFFTKAFFDAAVGKNIGENVYYRDIQNYISDTFRDDPRQTPLFVSQVTGLEVFATSNNDIKNLKATYRSLTEQKIRDKSVSERVLESVNEMELHYLPKERIDSLLNSIEPAKLAISLSDEVVQNLYTIENIDSVSLQEIGSAKMIAQEVNNKKWKNDCFIEIIKESYKVRQLRQDLSTRLSIGLMTSTISGASKKLDDSYYETVINERPASIKINHQMPFDCLRLKIKPLKLCLSPWDSYLFILPARTYYVLGLGFVKLVRASLDEFKLVSSEIEWVYEEFSWRDWDHTSPIDALTSQVEKRLRQDALQLTGLILDDRDETNEEE